MKTRMSREPPFDGWMFMSCVVVHYEMQVELVWHLMVDCFKKPDELLVTVPRHTLTDYFAIENRKRTEQCGCSIAFVIMCYGGTTTVR